MKPLSWGSVVLSLAIIVYLAPSNAFPGSFTDGHIVISQGDSGKGGPYINVTIENVEADRYDVTRGDTVLFKVTLHNRGELGESSVTMYAIAGKKVLSSKLVSLDSWDVRDRMVVDFPWNTADSPPGTYRVTIDFPLSGDADEFDNRYRLSRNITIR
ncbi:MAG: hypothetical protein GTN70_05095 [Deltaproteobacteria bacterium]|nr:hypothetical protein [Deltaproteobacteria bacterium]NIS77054.1 hypothetical protein [Deltaproteobacteria bacterium]